MNVRSGGSAPLFANCAASSFGYGCGNLSDSLPGRSNIFPSSSGPSTTITCYRPQHTGLLDGTKWHIMSSRHWRCTCAASLASAVSLRIKKGWVQWVIFTSCCQRSEFSSVLTLLLSDRKASVLFKPAPRVLTYNTTNSTSVTKGSLDKK